MRQFVYQRDGEFWQPPYYRHHLIFVTSMWYFQLSDESRYKPINVMIVVNLAIFPPIITGVNCIVVLILLDKSMTVVFEALMFYQVVVPFDDSW